MFEKLKKAIEIYNRYRSPEATARLLEVRGQELVVEFEGPFCDTCGVVDWLEDLVYEAENLGLRLRLVDFEKVGDYKIVAKFWIDS